MPQRKRGNGYNSAIESAGEHSHYLISGKPCQGLPVHWNVVESISDHRLRSRAIGLVGNGYCPGAFRRQTRFGTNQRVDLQGDCRVGTQIPFGGFPALTDIFFLEAKKGPALYQNIVLNPEIKQVAK